MTSRSSLVNRLAVVIGAVVLTGIVSMATTLAVSSNIEGNATAINQAGALRMGAFQLAARAATDDFRHGQAAIDARIRDYESRLGATAITQSVPSTREHPLSVQYQATEAAWRDQLKPALQRHEAGTPLTREIVTAVETYTREVDQLVSMLERRTEARIELLHLIQVISIVFSVLIVVALFLDIKTRILRPLRKLIRIANAIAEHDFTRKAQLPGSDELSQLGQAFDQMTSDLALSYQELEQRAWQKTEELETSHAALQLMHSASRDLFASHDLCTGAVPMLQELERLLGIGPIRLFLHDKESAEPVEAIVTATPKRPFYCRDHHCNACLVSPQQYDEMPLEDNDGRRLLLPIRTPGHLLGTLEVWYPTAVGLSDTTRRLLETLTDQLATAIFLAKQITEEQQLTLVEERTVIARELHDSLAQSLSYLKMQVTRLRRLDIQGEQRPLHDEILNELSTGLNSAYRQLRELLATFRLKLDTPDLLTALHKTLDEFSERLGKPVGFEYNLPPQMLSANEEIHTLQIIREGLSNAVRHADASEILVSVLFESPRVRVSIQDNGKGLPGSGQPPSHYGLIIMQDRARTLGGQMLVRNRSEGGVEVALTFVPKSRNLIPAEASQA